MAWDDYFEEEHKCECGKDFVLPCGPKDAPVLIISDRPGDDELKVGVPFVGGAGGILKTELSKLNHSFSEFRITNLWLHEPNNDDNCRQIGFDEGIKEANGRELIIIMGSDVTRAYTDDTVTNLAGVDGVKSHYFSAPVSVCFNPASCYHGGIGDFRLSLQKAMEKVEEICF